MLIFRRIQIWQIALLGIVLLFSILYNISFASDSLCARVKIEIKQELTLERQAFDAHMRITNGLSNVSIENVKVEVKFMDRDGNPVRATSDPNDTSALFFIRVDTMDGINDVDGAGRVAPSSTADIHWLIIPAPGAAEENPRGTLYYVGATLSYTIGGEEHVTEVSPDYIYVKPMPELVLDYFLPREVYGDDAFTPELEPPVPFSLGVRVKNNGFGTAHNLRIESAQPKIVKNENQLLIDFTIIGSEVNGKPGTDSLLVDFGDIEPGRCGTARWIMECTLSGKFVEFTADFVHADELGGEVTSLMKEVKTHFLIHDVLVDLPGRDNIRDFLAKDGDVIKLYESEGIDTPVMDQSALASLERDESEGGYAYRLTVPVTEGPIFVKLEDPTNGNLSIINAIRDDGKMISLDNVWQSKERGPNHEWKHFINLFDINTPGGYTIFFGETSGNIPVPLIDVIPDHVVRAGEIVSFLIRAGSPDGTIPELYAENLPDGASFVDRGDGYGIFEWRTASDDIGEYQIEFHAKNAWGEATRVAKIEVVGSEEVDSDGDGMPDEWEMRYFGTLDRDGRGDFDGDGLTDLEEYQLGSDPTVSNAPTIPQIISPADESEVSVLCPEFRVLNSIDPDGDNVTYEVEIYRGRGLTDLVSAWTVSAQYGNETVWECIDQLTENTWYYWRVRATDGHGYSQWAYGSFFVNVANDAPEGCKIEYPEEGSFIDTARPTFRVINARDPEGDELRVSFDLFSDSFLENQVASSGWIEPGEEGFTTWEVSQDLEEDHEYYLLVTFMDEHGANGTCGPVAFTVNTSNQAPPRPEIIEPLNGTEINADSVDLVVAHLVDPDGDPVSFLFQIDTSENFDSPDLMESGEISQVEEGNTSWHVEGLLENTWYYWRVKATDGMSQSAWSYGSFFVNAENEPPGTPKVVNPGDGAEVSDTTPVLEVTPVTDPDSDSVTYRFMLYSDSEGTQLVAQGEVSEPRWEVPVELTNRTTYYWTCEAVDEHGLVGEAMPLARFVVNTGEAVPDHLVLIPESEEVEVGEAFRLRVKVLDSEEQLVEDFNEDVRLSLDNEEGSITPSVLRGFVNGEWNGQVIIEGVYDVEVIITAQTDSGITGQTGPIRVSCTVPLPPERVYPEDNATVNKGDITFSWKVREGARSYELEVGADDEMSEVIYEASGITTAFIQVPSSELGDLLEEGGRYYWRMRSVGECGAGEWSEVWSFKVPEVEPRLMLTYPVGGESIEAGSVVTVRWDYEGDVGDTIKIRYNTGGRRWNTIATGVDVTSGAYEWSLPSGLSGRCRIKIESEKDRTIYSIGSYFNIIEK